MEDKPSWEEVYLTPEENQKEMQHQQEQNLQRGQQDQGQDEQPEWWVPTPQWEQPSGDAYTGGMWDDGDRQDDDNADGNLTMERTYPSRGPTPISGLENDITAAQQPQYDDHGIEQPVSPALALGATDNDQQLPASASAEMAGSPDGAEEEKGRQGGRRKRRVIGPPVEGRRQSSRIRIKNNRMVEEGG